MTFPKWRAGETLSAAKLNRTQRAQNGAPGNRAGVRALSQERTRPLDVLEVKSFDIPGRNLICVIPGQSANPSAQQFTVQLPIVFGEASRGIYTYTYTGFNTRTANDGVDTEDQEITPPFVIGEVVAAFRIPDSALWLWLGDGRMWAKTA